MDLDTIAGTPASAVDVSKALARPSCFAYFGDREEMFTTWALGPIVEHRDSDPLTRSNAEALRRALVERFKEGEDFEEHSASHWAVGHVTHLSYRVIDDAGQPTPIARFLAGWAEALAEYPVADDDLFSEYELEEWEDTVDFLADGLVRCDFESVPEDWRERIGEILSRQDNDPSSLTDARVRAALVEIGGVLSEE